MDATKKDRALAVIAAIFLFALLWVMADASCAIDKKSIGCNFANGRAMSVVLPRLHAMESAFWRSLPG